LQIPFAKQQHALKKFSTFKPVNLKELIAQVRKKKSCLCVGLDSDAAKIPAGVGVVDFNVRIMEATAGYAVAYKLNTAFYEARGAEGWRWMQQTVEQVPRGCLVIIDAKRGDIGNTAEQYASAFYDVMRADAVTVNPYMGWDSVQPFLRPQKWAVVLALTSNAGAQDFQMLRVGQKHLYEEVLQQVSARAGADEVMFVAGATHVEMLKRVREIVPEHFLLIPGVGAQGGNLNEVMRIACNNNVGVLINSSRQIIYASAGADFAEAAGDEAKRLQKQMSDFI